VARLEVWNSTI